MPLLEINQTRYLRASVRLDESTTEQVDPYAAFVHPRMMLWIKRSTMSSRRAATFRTF